MKYTKVGSAIENAEACSAIENAEVGSAIENAKPELSRHRQTNQRNYYIRFVNTLKIIHLHNTAMYICCNEKLCATCVQ